MLSHVRGWAPTHVHGARSPPPQEPDTQPHKNPSPLCGGASGSLMDRGDPAPCTGAFTHGKARHTKSGEGRFRIPPQSTEATLASGSGRRLLPPGVATWKVFPRKRPCRSALIETLPTPTTDNNPQSRRIT